MSSVEEPALPSRKRARRLDTAEDRLSDLPDCLLHDVLSHLASRQAVQTSALSRRWRHLWRSVPCVDIDQRQFPGSDVTGSEERGRFEDFADSLLAFGGAGPSSRAPLDAFRLRLLDGRSASSSRWIRRGLKRRPATVDIRLVDNRGVVEWPPGNVIDTRLAAATCRLTRLTLSGVTLRYGILAKLGVLCPVLRELHIDKCHHQSSHCTLDSPTLKILSVLCRTDATVALAIEAPRLATLRLSVSYAGRAGNPVITAPGHEALPSLVRASIAIHDRDRPDKQPSKFKLEFLRSMCAFLARLYNVRTLRLLGFTTQALLDHESQEFPEFQNLTTLILHCCDVGEFNSQVLTRILDNTPNLQKIALHHCKFSGRLKGVRRKREQERTSSKQRVETLVQHKNLRSIEIKYQPDDQTHWRDFFARCSGKMELWPHVRRSYAEVPSIYANMGRGEVSNAASLPPVREMTVGLDRLRSTRRDPVATTTSRVQQRVTKNAGRRTRTNSQAAPRLNSTENDVQSTEDDTVHELKQQHRGTTSYRKIE